MTDKKNNNKKYTSAVRRELKRIVRRKLWRGFLVAGVMVMLIIIAALGLLTIVNYNQRSGFDNDVRTVCNGMYRVIKDGESDQEIREDIEGILSKCNTPYFVSKVYRYDDGVKLSGQDAWLEDDAEFEEDAAYEDDAELEDEDNSSDTGSGDDDFQPGDRFVENGVTYEWISTDEGITAVKVQSEDQVYEDIRSVSEIYHDFVAQGKDNVDFVNMEKQYESSRAYLNDVFEREGMDTNTDYEEDISWRGYYYRGRTVTVGGNDYYVAAAMYEDPFTRSEMGLFRIIIYMTPLVLLCYVITAAVFYRKKKKKNI